MDFFRVNMVVASSTLGASGIKDILAHWSSMPSPAPLARLEAALKDIKDFLRDLGQELAHGRRQRERVLREDLQCMLLLVPGCADEHLHELM